MKILIYAFAICCTMANAQTLKTKQTVVPIITERSIYLNGGARASVGGKSRATIKIDLPQNTKFWYYSFSTTPGESGVSNLNLAIQLSALALDLTGITKSVVSKIKVPEGATLIDVFVLDQNNSDAFMQKVDQNGGTFYFYRDGTISSTKHGVVHVGDVLQGPIYLGLKNPSVLEAVNINIEVVAITEQVEQLSDEESQAMTIGNLGWKAFERGDYDKCLELSQKAITMDPNLGYVQFNIALMYLIKGMNSDALTAYTKAITVTRRTSIPKQTFEGAIQDLRANMTKFPSQSDAQDVLSILLDEVKRF